MTQLSQTANPGRSQSQEALWLLPLQFHCVFSVSSHTPPSPSQIPCGILLVALQAKLWGDFYLLGKKKRGSSGRCDSGGWNIILQTEGSQVQFPVRVCVHEGNDIDVSLPLSLSLSLPLPLFLKAMKNVLRWGGGRVDVLRDYDHYLQKGNSVSASFLYRHKSACTGVVSTDTFFRNLVSLHSCFISRLERKLSINI